MRNQTFMQVIALVAIIPFLVMQQACATSSRTKEVQDHRRQDGGSMVHVVDDRGGRKLTKRDIKLDKKTQKLVSQMKKMGEGRDYNNVTCIQTAKGDLVCNKNGIDFSKFPKGSIGDSEATAKAGSDDWWKWLLLALAIAGTGAGIAGAILAPKDNVGRIHF